MRAISLFSGAGGLDIGMERAGAAAAVHVEIDPHAAAVLRYRWPDTPIHGDVTTFKGDGYAADVVHGGSPCTDLSVAGRRAGLAGSASGLYWHQVRVWRESQAPWFLWENVAGAFSSHCGSDFAAVLWGITGALPEVPAGGWRTGGFCVGPLGCAVWRLLDGRYFGVPQRRRRVFVVGCAATNLERAIAVLLDPASLSGDSPPSREAGESVAALTANGVGTCGADDNGQAGHLIPAMVSTNQGYPCVLSFNWKGSSHQSDDVQYGRTGSLGTTRQPAVAYPLAMRGREGGAELEMGEPDTYNALRAGNGGSSRSNTILTPQMAVRRLTPIECERLMGWPDDWTRWGMTPEGKVYELADSHRYAKCGNGVISYQGEWIGRRLSA